MNELKFFFSFWRTLVFRPTQFFKEHLAPDASRPYWEMALLLYFIRIAINFYRFLPSAETVGRFVVWMPFGILTIGPIFYFLGMRLFTKFIIYLLGGTATVRQTGAMNVYASSVPNMIYFSLWGASYFVSSRPILSGIGYLVFCLCAIAYTFYVRYCAAMTFPGTRRDRAIFLFFILPILLVSVVVVLMLLALRD